MSFIPLFFFSYSQAFFFYDSPYIFLTVFRSNIPSAFISSVVNIQVPDPQVSTGRTEVSYRSSIIIISSLTFTFLKN